METGMRFRPLLLLSDHELSGHHLPNLSSSKSIAPFTPDSKAHLLSSPAATAVTMTNLLVPVFGVFIYQGA